jgi:hypothetical protein
VASQDFRPAYTDKRAQIALFMLLRLGFEVRMPNPYQIKVGRFNFYWSTDKFTIDGKSPPKAIGLTAFIGLLKANSVAKTPVAQFVQRLVKAGECPIILPPAVDLGPEPSMDDIPF